ncbi:MAG: ribosome recycling factor [Gemmataceae bacterium]|jgi:ribosome recycling factor|nr:ribosome recycling factor [Gemmataceae bacterium]
MSIDKELKDARERMEKALDVLKNELRGLRTGRATPALLDAIRVDYYGSPTPIKQIATVSTPDSQSLMIKPFNAPDLKEIEKAIRSSDLGLAPDNDGKVIRLKIPPMSGDQRTKLTKKVKELAEAAKVSCRNIRRDSNKHLETAEKEGKLTEDDLKTGKEKIQDLLKNYENQIDSTAAAKTKEINET